jgi:hypothetical protein
MNYNKIYKSLVSHRKQYLATGYTENHHIIMRSMGGDNSDANLVSLTGREHWIAHLLLHKIHRNSQTAFACNMMAMRCEERGIPFVKNSRMYEHIRKLSTKFVGDKNKITHIGEGNSQYGSVWICNVILQINKKISKYESIPDGWMLGRNKWKMISKCVECTNTFNRECNEKFCSSVCKNTYRVKNKPPITEKTKRILSESAKKRANEHPYTVYVDTMWITDGCVNKRISKSLEIPESWRKGRVKGSVCPSATNRLKG